MASWKKVIVSGSSANLASLQVDNLLNGVVTGSSNGTLGIQSINGTGSIVATTNATGLVHSGSFSGSFQGSHIGPLTGTASWATNAISASWVSSSAVYGPNGLNSILSSSYALSASYAFNSTSASFALTSSLPLLGLITASVNVSTIQFTKGDGSQFSITISQSGSAASANTVVMNNTNTGIYYPTFAVSGSNSQSLYVNSSSFSYNAATNTLSTTASWATSASSAISSSYSFNATSASIASTASYVLQAVSASFATLAQTANTASYIATASYASNADLLDGLHASIFATTGSNTFIGNQTVSGSVNVTGSISLTGSLNILGSISASAFSGSHFGTSSWASNATTASYANVATSASYASSSTSASYALTASYAANGGTLTNALTFGTGLSGSASTFNGSAAVTVAISGSSALSTNSLPKWTGTGLANSNVSDNGTTVTIATSASVSAGGINVTGNSIFNNNVTVTGDLAVNGTTTFINTTNTYIKDQLVLLNSGSNSLGDGGIVVQYSTGSGAGPIGSAFFLESTSAGTYGRWAVAFDITGSQTSIVANEYMVSVLVSASAVPPTVPTWGGATNGSGNMYINSGNGDIYIYA